MRKISWIVLITVLILLVGVPLIFGSGEMEIAQYNKARAAEKGEVYRHLKVYDHGVLIWETEGYMNLEGSETSLDIYTITIKNGEDIQSHKIKCTAMILEEIGQ